MASDTSIHGPVRSSLQNVEAKGRMRHLLLNVVSESKLGSPARGAESPSDGMDANMSFSHLLDSADAAQDLSG